ELPILTLNVSGAASVAEGSPYTLNLSAHGPGSESITGWIIDWKDGSTQAVSGNPPSVTHAYADGPNSYTISATASNAQGTFAADNTVGVTVENVAPNVATAPNQNAVESTATSFNLGSFTDQGSNDNPWQVTINWGDSSNDTFNESNQGSLGTLSHTYADNGT